MMNKTIRISLVLLALMFGHAAHTQSSSTAAEPEYADWPTGAIYAIHYTERKIVIGGQQFRVALKASIRYADGSKASFDQLEPKYYVGYHLEADTGDIVDLVVIAIP